MDTFSADRRLEFLPERWQDLRDKRSGEPSRFEYIPFGGGQRKCVGREFALMFMRLFTVELCRICDWQLKSGNRMPVMKTDPFPFPMDGMPLYVSKAQFLCDNEP